MTKSFKISYILLIISNLSFGQGKKQGFFGWNFSYDRELIKFFDQDKNLHSERLEQVIYSNMKFSQEFRENWEMGVKFHFEVFKSKFENFDRAETSIDKFSALRFSSFGRRLWKFDKIQIHIESDNQLGMRMDKKRKKRTFILSQIGVGVNYFFTKQTGIEIQVDTILLGFNYSRLGLNSGVNLRFGINHLLY